MKKCMIDINKRVHEIHGDPNAQLEETFLSPDRATEKAQEEEDDGSSIFERPLFNMIVRSTQVLLALRKIHQK